MPLRSDAKALFPLGTPRGQDMALTMVWARNPARARYAVLKRIGPPRLADERLASWHPIEDAEYQIP